MSDVIDWGKVGGRIFAAPVGSLDFKEVHPIPTKTTCISTGNSETPWDDVPSSFEVKVKWSENDRRKFRGLFARKRLPRKTKKAIKKQCPGITPSEIQKLLFDGWHFRRIKHKRK